MSIAIFHLQAAGEDLKVEAVEVDPPQANEIRIQILYTGICHTYVSVIFAHLVTYLENESELLP
jgi:Zn-dependent alcohol dehydrogenase